MHKPVSSIAHVYVLTQVQMEIKMKSICDGQSQKRQVVQESLEMYRDVFMRTVQQMDVLRAVGFDLLRPFGLFTD